jgi:hypothetical protein
LSNQPERQLEHADPLNFTDIILPCQFFGNMGASSLCAEQRLMLAVLVDAINILQGWNRMGSARKRRAFAEAGQWVTTHGRSYPFSFDSVCDALSIDPEMLRERLASLVMGLGMQNRLGGTPAPEGVQPRPAYDGESGPPPQAAAPRRRSFLSVFAVRSFGGGAIPLSAGTASVNLRGDPPREW